MSLGLTIAQQHGETRRWVECRALLCMAQARTGNFAAALTGAAEVVACGERTRDHQVQVWGRLSAVEIHLAAGDVHAAMAEWQAASNLFTDSSRISRADQIWHTMLAARMAQISGDPQQAHELALQALQQIHGAPPLAIYLLRSYEALAQMPLPWRHHWEARFIRWQVGLIFPVALRSRQQRRR